MSKSVELSPENRRYLPSCCDDCEVFTVFQHEFSTPSGVVVHLFGHRAEGVDNPTFIGITNRQLFDVSLDLWGVIVHPWLIEQHPYRRVTVVSSPQEVRDAELPITMADGGSSVPEQRKNQGSTVSD